MQSKASQILGFCAAVLACAVQTGLCSSAHAGEEEQAVNPIVQATAGGAAAFREVCLTNIGRREAVQAAAKAARFTPMPQAQTRNVPGVWRAGDAWWSKNGGYPLVLLISESGHECTVILRQADPGAVTALAIILPQVFRKTPGSEVRITHEADQPDREVIAFRVKSPSSTPELADRLVILEPDFRPNAPVNMVLTLRLVKAD